MILSLLSSCRLSGSRSKRWFRWGGDTVGAGAVVGAMVAKSQLRASYWQYRNYKSGFVAEREVDGDVAEFQPDAVELPEGGRDVQVCFE